MAEATQGGDPLTPAVFHVLVALAGGPLHGYGIMRRVEEDSGLAMGPGTVYGTLHRLEDAGWIATAGSEDPDPRRGSAFVLTADGRRALDGELARFDRLTRLARERGLAPGGAAAS